MDTKRGLTSYERFEGGFTLIELSIVLVIIGLVVGSVLVGQDLIRAAYVRAQISQIEKYQTAVNTFYGKYGALPGDLQPIVASQFGFQMRAGGLGDGDGNGELDGTSGGAAYSWSQQGETLFFWEDLSRSGFIEGNFNSYNDGYSGCLRISCNLYIPTAKIGQGNDIYVYSGFASECCPQIGVSSYEFGPNFYGLSVIQGWVSGNVSSVYNGGYPAAPGLTVAQAYAIDKKSDDGLPTSGHVLAQYLADAPSGQNAFSTNGASPTATTCYDTSSGVAAYSLTFNGGTGVNCGISFQFQ
jgi:prepilin-type N-terminal cleavage/methylation domain-containing protein